MPLIITRNTNRPASQYNKFGDYCQKFLILSGLVASIVSATGICSDSCSATDGYKLFGMPFPVTGIGFFIVLGLLFLYSKRDAIANRFFWFCLVGAVGSELVFIRIQDVVIKQWCPICLTIASIVFLLFAISVYMQIAKQEERGWCMVKNVVRGKGFFKKVVVFLFVFSFAVVSTLFGVTKPDTKNELPNISFGDKKSSIQVFFITNWECSACRAHDVTLENIYESIKDKTEIFYVSKSTASTVDMLPLETSLMVYEKNKYPSLRKHIYKLINKQSSYTSQDFVSFLKQYNISYKEVSFFDANKVANFFDGIVKEHNIERTPSIVLKNTETKKVVVLEGAKNITLQKVEQAVKSLH